MTNIEHEVFENCGSMLCMPDFWMELESKEIALAIFHRGDLAIVGLAYDAEARGDFNNCIAVTHPDGHRCIWNIPKETAISRAMKKSASVLLCEAPRYMATF